MTSILGIDPGLSGALARLEGDDLIVVDMPVAKQNGKNRVIPGLLALEIARLAPVDHAFIEEVHAMPRQGVASTFNFGTSYGLVLGAVAALNIPFTTIRPPQWRKLAGVTSKPGDKGASRAHAVRLFPKNAGLFARVKDDGRAEAALIARAGLRSMHTD